MTKIEKHLLTVDEILSLHKERIRYIALADSFVNDYSTAEEIVQECLFGLLQSRTERYVSDCRPFFATSVKNRCLNYLKRKARECAMDGGGLLAADIEWLSSGSGDEGMRTDFSALLARCRDMMPRQTYEIFMAKRLDRMSYREISEAFHVSESRINFEMTRAQKVFREVFKDYRLFCAALLAMASSSV